MCFDTVRKSFLMLALAGAIGVGVACNREPEPIVERDAIGTSGVAGADDTIEQQLDRMFAENNVPDLDERDLDFEVENGVVTIEGEVRTQAARKMVEDRVRSVAGVTSVINKLEVEEAADRR